MNSTMSGQICHPEKTTEVCDATQILVMNILDLIELSHL